MTPAQPVRPAQAAWIWTFINAVLLWVHAQLYRGFLSDDALISMRYSERLLEGFGLTWTDGIPVEGYSNLLWVLLTAGLGALGMNLVDAVRTLGLAGNISVLFAILYLYLHVQPHNSGAVASAKVSSLWPLVLAQLFWLTLGSTAVWSMGGLEQPLVTAALVWAMALALPALMKPEVDFKSLWLASAGLAVVVLTRPDGPLFTACMTVTWWILRPKTWPNFLGAVALGVAPLLAFLGQLGFRLMYYGDWVPNTAHVKVVFTQSRLMSGVRYVIQALSVTSPFFEILIAGITCALAKNYHKPAFVFILTPLIAWLVYIASVGGDIFPAFRHGLLVYGLMSLTLLLLGFFAMPFIEKHSPTWLRWAMVPLILTPFLVFQIEQPQNKEAFYERWEWDGQAVGETLHAAFHTQQPLYAVTAAGSLPFWSKLPSLDMLGLNDYHIARNPPKDFGHGELGHDLGDGAYVLAQKPDIISFCGPYGSTEPCRLSGIQMVATSTFHEFYRPVFIAIQPKNGRPPFTNVQWVRWKDGAIGIKMKPGKLIIPAFLGARDRTTPAHLVPAHLVSQTETRPESHRLAFTLEPQQHIQLPVPHHLMNVNDIVVHTSAGSLTTANARLTVTMTPGQLIITNTDDVPITLIEVELQLAENSL